MSCGTPSTVRCPAVDSFLFEIPFSSTLHDFNGFQVVSISVPICDLGVDLYTQELVKFFRRRLFQDIKFSRLPDWHPLRGTSVHSLFCGAGRNTTYVYSQRQSWALVLLRLKQPGTWKQVPS